MTTLNLAEGEVDLNQFEEPTVVIKQNNLSAHLRALKRANNQPGSLATKYGQSGWQSHVFAPIEAGGIMTLSFETAKWTKKNNQKVEYVSQMPLLSGRPPKKSMVLSLRPSAPRAPNFQVETLADNSEVVFAINKAVKPYNLASGKREPARTYNNFHALDVVKEQNAFYLRGDDSELVIPLSDSKCVVHWPDETTSQLQLLSKADETIDTYATPTIDSSFFLERVSIINPVVITSEFQVGDNTWFALTTQNQQKFLGFFKCDDKANFTIANFAAAVPPTTAVAPEAAPAADAAPVPRIQNLVQYFKEGIGGPALYRTFQFGALLSALVVSDIVSNPLQIVLENIGWRNYRKFNEGLPVLLTRLGVFLIALVQTGFEMIVFGTSTKAFLGKLQLGIVGAMSLVGLTTAMKQGAVGGLALNASATGIASCLTLISSLFSVAEDVSLASGFSSDFYANVASLLYGDSDKARQYIKYVEGRQSFFFPSAAELPRLEGEKYDQLFSALSILVNLLVGQLGYRLSQSTFSVPNVSASFAGIMNTIGKTSQVITAVTNPGKNLAEKFAQVAENATSALEEVAAVPEENKLVKQAVGTPGTRADLDKLSAFFLNRLPNAATLDQCISAMRLFYNDHPEVEGKKFALNKLSALDQPGSCFAQPAVTAAYILPPKNFLINAAVFTAYNNSQLIPYRVQKRNSNLTDTWEAAPPNNLGVSLQQILSAPLPLLVTS